MKTGNFFGVLLMLSLCTAFNSCDKIDVLKPSGVSAERSVTPTGEIRDIEISNAFKLVLTAGSTNTIRIKADEKILPKVEAYQEGFKLKCRLKPGYSIIANTEVIIYVTYTAALNEVDLEGASSASITDALAELKSFDMSLSGASYFKGKVKAKDIKVDISGASKVDADFEAESIYLELEGASYYDGSTKGSFIDLDLSGASKADIRGESSKLELDLSGASKLEGRNFICKGVDADLSSASLAYLNINGLLNLDASGGSILYYSGTPTLGSIALTGGSKIEQLR